MDPIAEEQDFAFTNLVYTEVGSTNTGLQYENVEGGIGHKYENVGQEATKYENVDNTSRYENVPNTDPARPCYQNVDITSENQNDKMSEEKSRRWALARAEHPVIDVEKLEDKPSTLFSSTEREIVAKFLENVKSELSTV